MPYCYYCGAYVRGGRCVKYHHLQLGSHRKIEHTGDCGFTERFITIGIVLVFLYFASGLILKFFTLILSLLNK